MLSASPRHKPTSARTSNMDQAYYNWLWLVGIGAFAGLFLQPKVILICAAVCWVIALVGLAISAASHGENMTMYFGIALMVIPVLGGMTALGAGLTSTLRQAFAKQGAKNTNENPKK